jgi:molybdopterin-guanine dinucleotide biosynthesis protein A
MMESVRPETSAAVVAGGLARRFGGRDKGRLVVGGRPIIVRQIAVLQQVARDLFVVAPDPARYADLQLAVHPDVIPGKGAIGGIHTALERASSDAVIVVAGDMPFLSAPLLEHLVDASEGADGAWVVGPRGPEPLLACYRRSARPAVHALIEAGRLRAGGLGDALRLHEVGADVVAGFGPLDELLANVNTPDDLARLQ